MKSFLKTALTALLGLMLTSVAVAQKSQSSSQDAQALDQKAVQAPPGNPYQLPGISQDAASQAAPLPVAEAKKRYLATQERLQSLAKGGNLPSARWKAEARLNIEVDEQPRDRLRAAVVEDFDARRQLQQAELAELESRIVRIKRALQIRDAMRDTLIDQRTDELLDQLEHGGKPHEPAAPGGGRPVKRGTNDRAATPPADSALALKEESRILKQQLDEAKANVESAQRAYDRALKAFKSGAISNEVLAEEEQKQKTAKTAHDHILLQWAAFLEAHNSNLPATTEPPAGDGAVTDQPKTERVGQLDVKEAQVDVLEAEANLSAAKRAYEFLEKMRAEGKGVPTDALEKPAVKLERAKVELDRAKARLDALLKAHPDLPAAKGAPARDGAVNDPKRTLDQAAIAEAPVDDGALVDDHAMRAALESDVAEAKANRESAEREYKRFEKMGASGAVEQAIVDEKIEQCKRSQIQLERQELKRDAFLQATDKPPVDAAEFNRRLAALDVQEAEANLAEQEIRYERFKRHLAANAIQPRLADEQAETYKQAQIQLERAKAKLKALTEPATGDRQVDKLPKQLQ